MTTVPAVTVTPTNLTEQNIIDILLSEMKLDKNQIWIGHQNYKIPDSKQMFIIVTMSDAKIIGNNNEVLPTTAGMTQNQGVAAAEKIQIDIMSRSQEAIYRRWEILQALQSVFSEQQQEKLFFRIFSQPSSFINTSNAEGGSNINRFTIVITCHAWHSKQVVLGSGDYYDDFTTRVDDEETIGTDTPLIEFEIPNP